MRWFRAFLITFLVFGMLLSSGLVVYANDGEEENNDGDEEDPEGGLKVDIVVVGENAVVTLTTTGTEIYLDGRNINKPIVKRTIRKYYIENPYDDTMLRVLLEEAGAKLDLTGRGLAKVILIIGEHTSNLGELLEIVTQNEEDSVSRNNELVTAGEDQDLLIFQLGGELLILRRSLEDHRVSTSELLNNMEADYQTALADMDARVDELSSDFNAKLVWTWSGFGVFGLLLLGIWRLWQVRLRRD